MPAATAPAVSPPTRWHAQADLAAIQATAERTTLTAARDAIAARGRFVVVLAGGGTPHGLYERLRHAATDWSAWHVWFGDERCLPVDDQDRNSYMARRTWLEHVPIPSGQVHPIRGELGPVAAAAQYAEALADVDTFDVVLLGLGEDGHTASLFPGRRAGIGEHDPAAVAVFDAPKPPAERVSLGASRLSDTRAALFLVAGEGKREAVRRWRAGDTIPASAIRPGGGVDVLVEASLLRD